MSFNFHGNDFSDSKLSPATVKICDFLFFVLFCFWFCFVFVLFCFLFCFLFFFCFFLILLLVFPPCWRSEKKKKKGHHSDTEVRQVMLVSVFNTCQTLVCRQNGVLVQPRFSRCKRSPLFITPFFILLHHDLFIQTSD